ncbi:MAG: DUF99 family protein [Thermoproteota archaeon]|nr:DUF99 family protein [Candidatus Brockarchaeota archaeon]MBO3801661.1 DUF99 family protein [Candidatus Brockarchaeota archaeon]
MVSLSKKAIRVLGIAESFRETSKKSILAGVVMRGDFLIDGFSFSFVTLRGNDATDSLIKLYTKLNRKDINVLMIGGIVISLYNIIDIDEVYKSLKIPIITVTYNESEGLEEHIIRNFPNDYQERLEVYRRLGKREKLMLKTNKEVFVRAEGISIESCKALLNRFTLNGKIPEPIRVARLLARSLLKTFIEF